MSEKPAPKETAGDILKRGLGGIFNGLREASIPKLWHGVLDIASSPFLGIGEIVNSTRKNVQNVMNKREREQFQAQRFQSEGFAPVPAVSLRGSLPDDIRFSDAGDGKHRLETTVIFPSGYAPCRIEIGRQIYETGDKLPPDCRLEAGETFVSDPQALKGYLVNRSVGYETGQGTRGYLKGTLGKLIRLGAPLVTGAAAAFGVIAGGAALGIATSATPLLASAAAVGFGGAWLARYFTPHIIARPLYARGKSGAMSEEQFGDAIDKNTHRFKTDYTVTPPQGGGAHAVQEGDLILGRAATASELGILRLDTTATPPTYGSGFLSADGKVFNSNDTIPKGTVIPHGTNWSNRGNIPAYTEYRRPTHIRSAKVSVSDLNGKNSVILENDCLPEADIILSQPTTFGFDVAGISAGDIVPAGTVIPKRTLMTAGTVIPAGSKMNVMTRVSRTALHSMAEGPITSTGVQLDTVTTLRRGIEIPEGILIPETGESELSILCLQADGKVAEQTINFKNLPKSQTKNGYRVYRAPRGSIHAGSVLPEGTIISGGSELKKSSIDAASMPVNRYLDQDIDLTSDCDLGTLMDTATTAPKYNVLYISEAITGGIGIDCKDPITGSKYPTGHDIPKGTHIQATVATPPSSITIPAGTIIPGGSILKEIEITH